MKRRRSDGSTVLPPTNLLVFTPSDWLEQVDALECEQQAQQRGGTAAGWREQHALTLWSRARLAWWDVHGWPGGLGALDLLRHTATMRRRSPVRS